MNLTIVIDYFLVYASQKDGIFVSAPNNCSSDLFTETY